MSDTRQPPKGGVKKAGSRKSAASKRKRPDKPPLDHVPPEKPRRGRDSADEAARDHASQENTPRDHAQPDNAPQENTPRDHTPPEPGDRVQSPEESFVDHLKSRDSWMRLLYMVLFFALWTVTRFVVIAVIVLQVLFLLFSGQRNERLAGFGAGLAAYVRQLVAYLTLADERQPFPFSDWPDDAPMPSDATDPEYADNKADAERDA